MVQATSGNGGKGDARRPCLVSQAEYDLRWEYGTHKITQKVFFERLKELKDAEFKAKNS